MNLYASTMRQAKEMVVQLDPTPLYILSRSAKAQGGLASQISHAFNAYVWA